MALNSSLGHVYEFIGGRSFKCKWTIVANHWVDLANFNEMHKTSGGWGTRPCISIDYERLNMKNRK